MRLGCRNIEKITSKKSGGGSYAQNWDASDEQFAAKIARRQPISDPKKYCNKRRRQLFRNAAGEDCGDYANLSEGREYAQNALQIEIGGTGMWL